MLFSPSGKVMRGRSVFGIRAVSLNCHFYLPTLSSRLIGHLFWDSQAFGLLEKTFLVAAWAEDGNLTGTYREARRAPEDGCVPPSSGKPQPQGQEAQHPRMRGLHHTKLLKTGTGWKLNRFSQPQTNSTPPEFLSDGSHCLERHKINLGNSCTCCDNKYKGSRMDAKPTPEAYQDWRTKIWN